MDKTAMAQMLDQLKLQLGAEKLSQMIDDSFWMNLERQQIEDAFKAGFKEGELEVQDYNPNYYNAENYYQSKYTKGG